MSETTSGTSGTTSGTASGTAGETAGETKPAVKWLDEIHDDLSRRYAELLWILRHASAGHDDVMVRHAALALASLDGALEHLDDYFWLYDRQPGGSDVSTGTVDVPYPHDGGGSGGGLRWQRRRAREGRPAGTASA